MTFINPVTLEKRGVVLAPLDLSHEHGLRQAAADGALWNLRTTSVPSPDDTRKYIETALEHRETGYRFAFAVFEKTSGRVIGCTSFHDILPEVKRVEIGHTWYAKSVQRTHVNTVCKLLLLDHAFDSLECNVVGWRTDIYNFASQRAIERLGAKKDGVVRGNLLRKDGTIRDTVFYSLHKGEWPEVKAHLDYLLNVKYA